MRRLERLGLLLLVATLAGCTTTLFDRQFVPPPPPAITSYTDTPLPANTAGAAVPGGQAQTFHTGSEVPDHWWRIFGSSQLDRLVEEVLANNPNLAIARRALAQAQANFDAGRYSLMPTISFPSLQAGVSSQSPFSYGIAGDIRISYSFDICCMGALNRQSAAIALKGQQMALAASTITLTANVVNLAINFAVLQERLAATEEVLALQSELLEISRRRFALGDLSPLDIAAQETQFVNSQSSLNGMQRQLTQLRNQLAVMLGRFPHEVDALAIRLDDLVLPVDIPLSLPSQLVAQRPDIVQATYALETATLNIGVAWAGLLPQLSLSASFTPLDFAWNLTASIVQAAINLGTTPQRIAAARAALSYQSTVIAAFIDVANVLQNVVYDAQALALQVEAERASRNGLDLARQQYDLGLVPYSTVLQAQQSYINAVGGLLQARATRLSTTVALYVALGGGWWHLDESTLLGDAAR